MKTALITSGGGAKGAFTVGALLALKDLQLADFDIISGTSTGSLIAALAAVGKFDILQREYSNVSNEDILQSQNFVQNLAQGKPYFFDTIPLERKILQFIDDAVYQKIIDSGKYVCFTAISLQSGMITVFSTRMFNPPPNSIYKVVQVTSPQMLRDAVLASSSQAAFLKPVEINGEQYVDGGNRDVLPTRPPVDLGAEVIYAMSNNPPEIAPVNGHYSSLIEVLLRSISIFIQDVRVNDYDYLDRSDAKVYKIHPNTDLDKNNPTGLFFDKNLMIAWMQNGYLLTKNIVENDPPDAGLIT